MKDLLMKEKQWDNIHGDSKYDEIKEKADDGNDADDDNDDCKVANEYVPLVSELDDQECKEITENVAQLDEIIEESASHYIFTPKTYTQH